MFTLGLEREEVRKKDEKPGVRAQTLRYHTATTNSSGDGRGGNPSTATARQRKRGNNVEQHYHTDTKQLFAVSVGYPCSKQPIHVSSNHPPVYFPPPPPLSKRDEPSIPLVICTGQGTTEKCRLNSHRNSQQPSRDRVSPAQP